MIRLRSINIDVDEKDTGSRHGQRTREAEEAELVQKYTTALGLRADNRKSAFTIFEEIIAADACIDIDVSDADAPHPPDSTIAMLKYSALKNLAELCDEEGNCSKAVSLSLEAAKIDSSDVSLWYRIGLRAKRTGDKVLARYAFEQGLSRRPNHPLCLRQLNAVLVDLDDRSAHFKLAHYNGRQLHKTESHVIAAQGNSVAVSFQRNSESTKTSEGTVCVLSSIELAQNDWNSVCTALLDFNQAKCSEAQTIRLLVSHLSECVVCQKPGQIVMCEGHGCRQVYHAECIGLAEPPSGEWMCPACQSGSVSIPSSKLTQSALRHQNGKSRMELSQDFESAGQRKRIRLSNFETRGSSMGTSDLSFVIRPGLGTRSCNLPFTKTASSSNSIPMISVG